MKVTVLVLSMLIVAPVIAQRGGGTPAPPATETVAPGIPGVVAAGTKVVVVKDGLRSSEGPIAMPDGSTLFTEPGASVVHKIDKAGNISTFLENTNRANGLALDSKGRLDCRDSTDHRGPASRGQQSCSREDAHAAQRSRH